MDGEEAWKRSQYVIITSIYFGPGLLNKDGPEELLIHSGPTESWQTARGVNRDIVIHKDRGAKSIYEKLDLVNACTIHSMTDENFRNTVL